MKPRQANTLFFSVIGCLFVWLSFAGLSFGRNIFLNGVDVSSTRSQLLENVTIQIDDKGDLFINAPNYLVQEEDNYVPLSRAQQTKQPLATPEHKAPIALPWSGAKRNSALKEEADGAERGAPKQEAPVSKIPVSRPTLEPPANPASGAQGVAGKTTTESTGSDAKAPQQTP